jgi:hypothetical protein
METDEMMHYWHESEVIIEKIQAMLNSEFFVRVSTRTAVALAAQRLNINTFGKALSDVEGGLAFTYMALGAMLAEEEYKLRSVAE